MPLNTYWYIAFLAVIAVGPQKENQKPAIRGHGPWPMTHPLSFRRDFFDLTD